MIMNTILYCIAILLLSKVVKNDILSMSIKRTGYGEFSVNTYINGQSHYMAVNPSSPVTTLQTNYEDEHAEKAIFEVNRKMHTFPIQRGEIKLDDVPIPEFNYVILTNSINSDIPDSLSFALKPLNESFSLIHTLYNAKRIDELKWVMAPVSTYDGNLYIGGVPEDEIKGKAYGECSAKNETWACTLDTVRYKDENNQYVNIFDIKFFSYIHFGYGLIVAPLSQLKILENKFFRQYLDNGKCRRTHTYVLSYSCDTSEPYDNFPDEIEFVFGDYSYSFPKAIILENRGGYSFTFMIYPGRYAPQDIWIFGNLFLNKFISVFDHKTKTVKFYRNETEEIEGGYIHITKISNSFSTEGKATSKIIMSVLGGILFLALIMNIIFIYKEKLELIP